MVTPITHEQGLDSLRMGARLHELIAASRDRKAFLARLRREPAELRQYYAALNPRPRKVGRGDQ